MSEKKISLVLQSVMDDISKNMRGSGLRKKSDIGTVHVKQRLLKHKTVGKFIS